ncbi:MAG: hypothetical protein SGJ24_17710 [Chloroflexota bacterium]|nr:hypothetical protein [Chloroflexota bacterium]
MRVLFICLVVLVTVALAPMPPIGVSAADGYLRASRLGLTHIAHPSMSDPAVLAERYGNALLIGAGWHRFPVYWSDIERERGRRVWDSFDRIVVNDIQAGLKTDLILLNVPEWARASGNIANVFAPVFADGTDSPAPGKPLNPNNLWSDWTADAVRRYMPGGTLARQLGWAPDQGVLVWEAWNEPDLAMFWGGSIDEYARLLKVTYLTVHSVDPNARVMTAGFAYADPARGDWLAATLAIYAADLSAPASNWFMDIVALHTYVDPYRSPMLVEDARATLARYGLERPIWLNETGVPTWDDYPGETWTLGSPGARIYRRTMRQQAHYVIQSTVMAWAAGADVVMVHQLYDDCAASPPGTTFPPHRGELCTGALNLCSGEAFGMFRNTRAADCFTQHPQPGTARPAAAAYYRLASIFGGRAFAPVGTINLDGRGRAIAFHAASPLTGTPYDPAQIARHAALALFGTIETRIWVLWNSGGGDLDVAIPAVGTSARLYTLTDDYALSPVDGVYAFTVPPVDPAAYPPVSAAELARVDGEPYILVESVAPGWTSGVPSLRLEGVGDLNPSNAPLDPTPTAIVTVSPPSDLPSATPAYFVSTPNAAISTPPPPTLDPALDRDPPIPRMNALPPTSPAAIALAWAADEASGIAEYIVWVRIDGGDWLPWSSTLDTTAIYPGEPGHRYEFALWARDLAGNWSRNIELSPMTATQVE